MKVLPALVFPVLLLAAGDLSAQTYRLGPDSHTRDGVPRGRVEGPFPFTTSEVFAGTRRDFWVYLPAAAADAGAEGLALMVFQDGHAYVDGGGQLRVPVVFDNLIAAGEMPPTVGIFVNPGHRGEEPLGAEGWRPRSNRSVEYDSLGDDYARFVIDELVPHVAGRFDLRLSDDPSRRAIAGMSSGGICAWTVAWERPDSFGRVLSHIGSFVNIRGGHVYPALIRKTDRKPVRVFLQDGSNDLNNAHGSWPLANRQMAASLAFAGYDFHFVFGEGAHNGEHGGAILPDSLRWLWRDVPAVAGAAAGAAAGGWEQVGAGYRFLDGLCAVEGAGARRVLFSDLPGRALHMQAGAGEPVPLPVGSGLRVSGLEAGPDGRLYAAVQGTGEDEARRIVVIDPLSGGVETVAERVSPNDLAVSPGGWIYYTDTGAGTVVRVGTGARRMPRPPVVAGGIERPNGIALSPDGSRLYVSEHGGDRVWRFHLDDRGEVHGGEPWLTLASPEGEPSRGDGMDVDTAGRLYVTSRLGIQVFDAGGAFLGLVEPPGGDRPCVSCAVVGDWLYAAAGDALFRRPLGGSGG